MKKTFTRVLMIFSMLFFTGTLYSQGIIRKVPEDKKDFKLLKNAQNYFELGDYGKALSEAEQAKENRIQQCKYDLYVLQNLQRYEYVRRAGDGISDILPVLKEHTQNEAFNLISSYIKKYGSERFQNSYSSLINFIEEHKVYPEADFLIGKVYRLEGETGLAEKYYLQAYKAENLLDVNDVKYEILYELADLCAYSGDKTEYEKYLLLILKDSRFYVDEAFMNSISRMIKQNKAENVEKFFIMYRCDEYFTIRALNLLTTYYIETSDNEKALKCAALGSITALTRMEEILKDRMHLYKYTSFVDLLKKCSKYPDIGRWGNTNGVWELFYNLGEIANTMTFTEFSNSLFKILAENPIEPYYQNMAKKKINL